MISIQQAQNGLYKYIDMEMLPHLTGFKKIGLSAYASLSANNVRELITKYKDHPAMSVTHLVDENCNIDIESLYNAIAPQFTERQKLNIPLIGEFVFSREDIDKIYNYMRGVE